MTQHHITDAGDNIITKPLDEQQQLINHQEDSTLRRTQDDRVLKSHFRYVFTTTDVEERIRHTVGRTLSA